MNYTSPSNSQRVSGYDIPMVVNDNFTIIHISAISSIICSFICLIIIICHSFYTNGFCRFYSWSMGDRFVIYLALCDGLFNMVNICDHIQNYISKQHVHPPWLCELYGFIKMESITAQNLLVNVIAINSFLLICFRKQLNFGKYDEKLLVYVFGLPCIASAVVASVGHFGPAVSTCYYDFIKGNISKLIFLKITITVIFIMNVVCYVVIWCKIYTNSKNSHISNDKSSRRHHRVAKIMMLFVMAFFIQWLPATVYGWWPFISDKTPVLLVKFGAIFCNIGGVLNAGVYVFIRINRDMSNDGVTLVTRGRNTKITRV